MIKFYLLNIQSLLYLVLVFLVDAIWLKVTLTLMSIWFYVQAIMSVRNEHDLSTGSIDELL